jgi:hypothetical protein
MRRAALLLAGLLVTAVFGAAVLAGAVAGTAIPGGDVSAGQTSGGPASGGPPSGRAVASIPPTYLALYQQAAMTCPGLPWSVLAAIGTVESDNGQSVAAGVSSGANFAGAEGPMQFEPGTWANYGQGGNIWDPHDSILAAARYLAHWGAPGDMRTAIFHYNLDYDYVDAVEFFARALRADPTWLDRFYYWGTTG